MAPDSSLAERVPPRPGNTPEQLLDLFLGHVQAIGLELYPAQEQALLELCTGNNVVLATPTGSGKSLVALAMHFFALSEGKRSFYTAPIKALVSEKFFALCRDFGPDHVGMITGDAAVNRDAPIICCTAEILSNMALREGKRAPADCIVIDEFHYYADRERGVAWQIPLIVLERAQFLLMSATIGPTEPFEKALTKLTKRPTVAVRSTLRPVPLDFEYRETPLHETIAELVRTGRSPVYAVNFTQRVRQPGWRKHLMSVDFHVAKERKRAIAEELGKVRFGYALRQGGEALSGARRRYSPRGALAEISPAGRKACPEGTARDRERHRHAGRGREHPDSNGALHGYARVRRWRRQRS